MKRSHESDTSHCEHKQARDTETTTVWSEGKKENTRSRRESALASVVQSRSIHKVDCDVSTPTLTVSRGCAWMCTTTGILPVVFVLLTLERNEVLYSLSPASSRCATLACSPCMRSWPRGGAPRQALAHSKFVLHSTPTFMDSQDSLRIIPPRRA